MHTVNNKRLAWLKFDETPRNQFGNIKFGEFYLHYTNILNKTPQVKKSEAKSEAPVSSYS